MQEDDPNAQPRIVYMHKCVELECWPATAVVSQLHLTHINLSYVIMDDKSKHLSLWNILYCCNCKIFKKFHAKSIVNVSCSTVLARPCRASHVHYSMLLLQDWCHAALPDGMMLFECSRQICMVTLH